MNNILVHLGLRPIAFATPREEYYAVLNHYIQTRDLQPALDLALRAAGEALPPSGSTSGT